jgi:hypothetical protein
MRFTVLAAAAALLLIGAAGPAAAQYGYGGGGYGYSNEYGYRGGYEQAPVQHCERYVAYYRTKKVWYGGGYGGGYYKYIKVPVYKQRCYYN